MDSKNTDKPSLSKSITVTREISYDDINITIPHEDVPNGLRNQFTGFKEITMGKQPE